MRNGFLFFLGLFAALALSWAGIVLGSNAQLGQLAPLMDENEGKAFPERFPGLAAQGEKVYRDLGCATCHTQQVRRPGFGSDKERGWGDRQSVARDYIQQPVVHLGESRIGPDLANVGARKPAYDEADLYKLLYAGTDTMPSYRFLFETRSTADRQPSDYALRLTGKLATPSGVEVVPTERARLLVAYLLSLHQSYEYPEARPIEPAKEGDK
ncbi:MAG: cbb3-type cytochrome c oxidase subunit II [Opitutus sp.]|nr:cbb3-type cytochrome c oxidase subunit II [Opitutus sp.]